MIMSENYIPDKEKKKIDFSDSHLPDTFEMHDVTDLYKMLKKLQHAHIQIYADEAERYYFMYNNKKVYIMDALKNELEKEDKMDEKKNEEVKSRKLVPAPKPNKKLEFHAKVCNDIHETYIKKNHDYGDSFSETFKKLGPISAITRISDKYNRLVNLVTSKDEAKVHDESIDDTLLDMANYCIMTYIERHPEEYE